MRVAAHGNAPQSRDSTSRRREISTTLEPFRAGRANSGWCERTAVARRARASSAWSCNSPDHGGHATSRALTCSIAWPAREWLPRHSPMRTQRERLRESPDKLFSLAALSTNLNAQDVRVKRALVSAVRWPARSVPFLSAKLTAPTPFSAPRPAEVGTLPAAGDRGLLSACTRRRLFFPN
jgi:hypothetical protein